MSRRPLIPTPSRDPLSGDYTPSSIVPMSIDPVKRVNMKQREAIPYPQRYMVIPDGEVNTMPSMFDIVETVWWPGEIPWEQAHPAIGAIVEDTNGLRVLGSRTNIDQQYASMPRGHENPLAIRMNIRQPAPISQGALQVLGEEAG